MTRGLGSARQQCRRKNQQTTIARTIGERDPFTSWTGVNSTIAIWCTIGVISGIIIILMVLVGQLRSKTAILTATLLALSAGQSTARGYEFCADTAHGMVTAITIANYCPMRFEYTTIHFQQLSSPTSFSNGLTSWYDDCASAPLTRRCTCFDRARSSLRRYFFTMKMKPLIAEEITICAVKKLYMIPAPVSMIQIDTIVCSVTYVSDRKFTIISNGYDFRCVFKIVGTEYFWRSPGCTKRRLVSCVTRASSRGGAIQCGSCMYRNKCI